ncbi:MAG: hypothetical protein FWC61_02860 [Proteobacteria bacterium]|nr:hypothetical protein [Pseudomonadota bacterium]
MNIFIMVLVFLFMAGIFFLDAPSQRIRDETLASALVQSNLRSIAECAANTHNSILAERESALACADKYGIATTQVCVDDKNKTIKCLEDRTGKFPASFVITKTPPIEKKNVHETLRVIEALAPTADNFGVLMTADGAEYLLAANGAKREIPATIIKDGGLSRLQIVYITKIPVQVPLQVAGAAGAPAAAQIVCNPGEAKVMKFGQWQCVTRNLADVCVGDMIWDANSLKCIADPLRRPLCGSNQTAVQVDDHWECADPILDKQCQTGMVARLDYSTMNWECVADPGAARAPTKCTPSAAAASAATLGATVRVQLTSCTDCEDAVTDPETCNTYCVPSSAKLSSPGCYPANAGSCAGLHKAFYFGFPALPYYLDNSRNAIPALKNIAIPTDATHSQNRKFNCMDCGDRFIDSARSAPPYVAVCE